MAHTVGSVSYLKSERRLERYAQSQLTVNEFCVWEGVSPATFCSWRKNLRRGMLQNASRIVALRASRSAMSPGQRSIGQRSCRYRWRQMSRRDQSHRHLERRAAPQVSQTASAWQWLGPQPIWRCCTVTSVVQSKGFGFGPQISLIPQMEGYRFGALSVPSGNLWFKKGSKWVLCGFGMISFFG